MKRVRLCSTIFTAFFILLTVIPLPASAADYKSVSSGDTAFILICTAMVMLMTPGVSLFYGGMVRGKNVLSILMQCLMIMGAVSIQWVLIGYSLSFGPGGHVFTGGLGWAGLKGVGLLPSTNYAVTIPHSAFAVFQMMFAVITVSLITGAVAERMRFSAFMIFALVWTTLVYDPLAHWVWGGGWLSRLGALDFAGGTVVHISSGIAGLVAALVLGERRGRDKEAMVPHSLPLTIIGAALLWFGWFGFNAGSALAANGNAALAFLVTNIAAAAAVISWAAAEWLRHGKPTVMGAASGAVAGLVAITPAAGYVTPASAIFIGLAAGTLCYFAVSTLKGRFGYDDALDVFGIHGVGGIIGAISTGIFSSLAVNAGGANGLWYGNASLVLVQLLAVTVTCLFSGLLTWLILRVIALFIPLRVSEEEEEVGLDISLHGEEAYSYEGISSGGMIRASGN